MLKKLSLFIATALTTVSVFATPPSVDKVSVPATLKATISASTIESTQAQAVAVADTEQLISSSILQAASRSKGAFSLSQAEIVPAADTMIGEPELSATAATGIPASSAAAHYAPGTVVPGTLFSKDVNYQGQLYSSRLTMKKADGDNSYTISNIYGFGADASVTATIDAATGKVTIPYQTVITVSQGDVKICPMTFLNGNPSYSTGNVTGTIDATGKITLSGWGLLFTEGENAGRGYNFFTSSEWIPANATVSAFDIVNAENVDYECLIEQSTPNSLTFYGLSGVTSETLNARITSGHSVQIPNSFVYSNLYYGDFFIYPYSIETGKAIAGQNLVGNYADKTISFPAWAIASRSYPTLYVGYKYSEIKVTPKIDITWPQATDFTADGEGTAENPFIINTVAQFQTLATAVAGGLDFDGDHFVLGADLDFSSVNPLEYQPVGDTATPFNGTFDGAGHTIKNLTVAPYSFYNLALFGHLGPNATVKNLNATNIRLASTGENVAVIAAFSEGTISNVQVTSSQIIANCALGGGIVGGLTAGTITDCSFQGAIQGVGAVAGIAGQSGNGSKISNCHTRANIVQAGYYSSACRDAGGIVGAAAATDISDCSASGILQDTKGYSATGGIVGRLLSESSLTRSLSVMMIQATANATIGSSSGSVVYCYQGGVVGYTYEAKEISDCYASAYIFQNSAAAANYAGGVVGYFAATYSYSTATGSSMNGITPFKNCYFSGQVYSASTESHKGLFGTTYVLDSWTGQRPWEVAFTNCYYDNQVGLLFGDEWGRPTSFFTQALPDGFDSAVWTAQAGRYPVLKSLDGRQVSELSSAPIVLADGQTATKVSKNFNITPATNVSWGISTDNGYAQQTDALAISGSTVTIKDQYDNALLAALSDDGWGIRLYRLSIVPKWFDGEGTADDPFQLKTADDFSKLNTAVGTYSQSHIGDYFKVMNDIDFTGSDFAGVACGVSTRTFGGNLDGNGKTLHNLNIDGIVLDSDGKVVQASSKQYVGLFGVLYQTAVIKNLTIAPDCSFKGHAYVGSIAGASFGRIENCNNYASVSSTNSYCGGILGFNINGTKPDGYDYDGAAVVGCYNAGAINGSYSAHGGIAGYSNALVSLCQNDGQVTGTSNSTDTQATQHNTIGGIVGYHYNGTIDRCVNNATVTGYYGVGGIAGSNGNGSILSSVNNGIVNTLVEDVRRGGIIGSLSSAGQISNNYYDSSINVNGGANNAGFGGISGLDSKAITSGEALEGLSTDDYDFAAGRYPVLKAFAAEPATVALRSMVAYFGPGEIRTNALAPVALSTDTQWTLAVNTAFSITDNTLSVVLPANLSVPNDTLTASKAGYTKVLPIAAIPVILNGQGTEDEPYLIETPDDWNKLSDFMLVNKYEYNGKFFRVVNDIDFKGDSIKLLAVNGVKFEGVFDGNNKTIKNYVYANANSTATATSWKGPNLYRGVNIGLFGAVGADGVIKNLTADGNFQGVNYIGGIAGDVYGTIQNCVHNGTIANTSGAVCSGVVSKLLSGGRLIDCVNNGSVTAKTTNASGIAYQIAEGAVAEGCVNNGKVTSTTTGANGIAYTVSGTVRNSANHGKLSGTGTAAGICNTLTKTGKLENCYNDADILYGEAGGSVAGIVFNTSDQTATDLSEPTSWLKGCYNTGNLSGKTGIYGIASTIKKGVLVEDCYNTGNVDAVTTYNAFGITGAISSNNADNLIPTRFVRCWNGGNISSNTATSSASGGFAKNVAAGTIIEDCYNLGDVTVKSQATSNSQICCAVGFICQISGGTISRCWNAGNVSGLTPCNGGIAGYISGTNCTLIEDCFNLGNISGSNMYDNKGVQTAGSTNGTAGGLFGYISTGNPVIRNCYNAGSVSGNNRVGGIAGGMFRPDAQVENCYNSGKVTCENNWWSGTIYTNAESYTSGGVTTPYFTNSKNVYYDADITTGTEYRTFPGSAKTTAQMAELELGDAFVLHHTYPVLKSFDSDNVTPVEQLASHVSAAMVVVAEGDTYSRVSDIVTLASAADVKWTATGDGELEIIGNAGYPRKTGKVTLTASAVGDDSINRSFDLNINATVTGIDDLDADGKTIVSTIYVDAAGRIISTPQPGTPYVVRITYDDGSSIVRKITARD